MNERSHRVEHDSARSERPAKAGGLAKILFEDRNQNGTITQVAQVLSNGQNVYIAEENEVLSIYHYYPFGLKHDTKWTDEPWENVVKGRKYDYQYDRLLRSNADRVGIRREPSA